MDRVYQTIFYTRNEVGSASSSQSDALTVAVGFSRHKSASAKAVTHGLYIDNDFVALATIENYPAGFSRR